MRPSRAAGAGILAALAVLAASCQDNEQRARAIGATARTEVAAKCASKPGSGDDADAIREGCIDDACRTSCAAPDVPPGFSQPCLDACRETATCATDADCGPGKACVAIAPVVRRCQPLPR